MFGQERGRKSSAKTGAWMVTVAGKEGGANGKAAFTGT